MTEEEVSKYRRRAEAILNAAGELVLRWGYKRVTIEEVAKRAGIGKGTIYLHFRTREELFLGMLSRESVGLINAYIDETWADPKNLLLHRNMRLTFAEAMRRPLVRAMFTRDTDVLGELAHESSIHAAQDAKVRLFGEYLILLRDNGLLRTDRDTVEQVYAISATVTGFYLLPSVLIERADDVAVTRRADLLEDTIRNAFEPSEPPRGTALRPLVPRVVALNEELRDVYAAATHGVPTVSTTGK